MNIIAYGNHQSSHAVRKKNITFAVIIQKFHSKYYIVYLYILKLR